MSDGATAEQPPGALTRAYRTVSPTYRWREDLEMGAVGWSLFVLLLALLVPLLPVIVVVWAVSKLVERAVPNR